jgi:flagellar basal-body rod protein FlgG
MNPALRAAASGMIAQQTRTEVIANNLANVNTTGFKRSRANFEDLLYQTVQSSAVIGAPESQTAPAIQIGRGTRLAAVQRLHAQGTLEQTNRPLDVAIEGEGFFQIQLASGQLAYTRDGSFQVSDQGTLVTSEGYPVEPTIRIPTDAAEVAISRTGVVTVRRGGDASGAPQEIGRLELARFANPRGCSPWARTSTPPRRRAATRWSASRRTTAWGASSRARSRGATSRSSRRWWT